MSDQGHVVLPESHRALQHGAVRVRDVDPQSQVTVTLTLRGPHLPALDATAPAISSSDFEDRYGASDADIAQVKRALDGFGLTVEDVSRAGRSVRVSGTASQMEAAFHPGLGVYRSEQQGEFRGREQDLQVPAELDKLVTGIFGFDQRRVARRANSTPSSAQVATATALSPADLEARYNFPPGDCNGRQVGIAEFGGAYFPEDLKAFCERHGLPEALVKIVDVGMKPPTPRQLEELPEEKRNEVLDDSGEVMMDVEIVAALCPGAEIFVYFAKFDQAGWIDLLNKVISGNPAAPIALSISWGLTEDSPAWTQAALKEIDLRMQAAAHLGITVCAASGDDGSGDQVEDGRAHVNFPASSPNVLSVGGTMLAGEDEVVWWQKPGRRTPAGTGSTGGGVSVIFQRPSWQTTKVDSLNAGGIDGREVPDIAALAGPPFYDLIFQGAVAPNGGTSAATPLWAALLTRLAAAGKPSQGKTFLAPLLYQDGPQGSPRGAEGCVDIVKGDNTSEPQPGVGYEAGPGYDAVSGWGVPDGKRLLASLP